MTAKAGDAAHSRAKGLLEALQLIATCHRYRKADILASA